MLVGDAIDKVAAACIRMQEVLAEEQHSLHQCLGQPQGRARELLTLRYAHDFKPRQIAARLGMSAGAVRVALTRIRAVLSKCVRQRLGRALT